MFDEFVLDGEAFERLARPGNRRWLNEWSELIRVLESEGSLTVADVGGAAKARSHERGWMLRRDLADPQRWWQAMAYYDSLTNRAERLLGDSPQDAQSLSWEFDPEEFASVPGTDGKSHNLSVVLHDAGESDVESHRDLFSYAMRSVSYQLQEVNAGLTACKELGVAPLMWAPYRRYLEEKLRQSPAADASFAQDAGHTFFEVTFPAYAPTTVREFATMRSDKRIRALRDEILSASRRGDLLDPQYPQRVLTEVLRMERYSARRRRIAGWIATAIGLVPVPGLGLAASVAVDAATGLADMKQRDGWHWFYLISDGRGAT